MALLYRKPHLLAVYFNVRSIVLFVQTVQPVQDVKQGIINQEILVLHVQPAVQHVPAPDLINVQAV